MLHSHSHLPSQQAPRLPGRLCQHFSHKIEARGNERQGPLRFPLASACCRPRIAACTAPSTVELVELQEVLRRHLQGVAQVENLQLQWQ